MLFFLPSVCPSSGKCKFHYQQPQEHKATVGEDPTGAFPGLEGTISAQQSLAWETLVTVVSWVTRARLGVQALLGGLCGGSGLAVWAGCGAALLQGFPQGRSHVGGRSGSICIAGPEVGAPGQVRLGCPLGDLGEERTPETDCI